MKCSILFIVFNRPDIALETFRAIRNYRPEKLYLAADGPRNDYPADQELCKETRNRIIDAIDWPCEVKTQFREKNLGCKYGPISAINWFFEHEEMGIILEDDCVPNKSFFQYANELLQRFKRDDRVMLVSGVNFQYGKRWTPFSYFFSRYATMSGAWATWRRAWKKFDDLDTWVEFKKSNHTEEMFVDPVEREYWSRVWDRVQSGEIASSWDYQWMYTCFINNGLCVTPEVNLAMNIGFGPGATHTKDPNAKGSMIKSIELEKIIHNPFIVPHKNADRRLFNEHFNGNQLRERRKPVYKIKSFLRYLYRGSVKHAKNIVGIKR